MEHYEQVTNNYTPEVLERAVRMVFNGEGQHESRWAAIVSISAKIGCAPQTLSYSPIFGQYLA